MIYMIVHDLDGVYYIKKKPNFPRQNELFFSKKLYRINKYKFMRAI